VLASFLVPMAWAQRTMTVAQLEQFITSSIRLKHPDRQVADTVRSLRLSERLDARTVENLQGLGAGPRTVAALKELSAASIGLPAPPPPVAVAAPVTIPPPSPEEQRRILAEITQNALDYTKGLPNFITTQITRRYVAPPATESWQLADTIQEQLSYVEGREDYKVILVNNLPVTNVAHHQLGGAVSSGEFATMLYQIFKPETETEFEWARWATLRGRRMHVYSFRVRQARSEYSIHDESSGRTMIAGYRGLIYADAETRMVMRIKMDCEGLQNFPISRVGLELDYDTVEISEQKFVLPLRFVLSSGSSNYASRNEVEFRRYQKFGAEVSIGFDVPEELPEEQFEEQPARP
jgi:hypothetical protein